jgi:hypothetical protein
MRFDQSTPPAPAENDGREPVSEQTPLLADQPQPAVEDAEPSTKRLLLVLCSVWVGVFLAALGIV